MKTDNLFIFNFNMASPVLKLFIRLALFCVPVILLLSLYFATDPFKVIYHYANYFDFASGNKPYVGLDKDYISTETFFNNYPTYQYDSFILGSSRSLVYAVKDWQEHISSNRCFHFDAAAESLYGIYAKLRYLDEKQISIKNILIILDIDVLSETGNSQGHLFLKHPELSGQNWFLFQMEFIKAFFDRGFLTEYVQFLLTDKIEKNLYQGGYLDDTPIEYDLKANEVYYKYYENLIDKDPSDYYLDGTARFFKRSGQIKTYSPVIKDKQKRLLKEIFEILSRNNTVYRIVISPLYNQIKFNHEDYNYLSGLFGRKNVYDFSGINDITNNLMNYYDWSHYRPHVAKYILNKIYN